MPEMTWIMKQRAIKLTTNSTMIRFLPLILLLLGTVQAFAQKTNSAQTLRLARATYEQGRLHEIPTQLSDAVIADMSNKQEKVEAYKILCLSYIYLEESEKADEAMLNILRSDPYFEINPEVDPAEFVALYKTFRTTPIYRIGAKIGGNFTWVNVSEVITAVSVSPGSEYKPLFGLQLGASADIPITMFGLKRITVHADVLYMQKKFELTLREERNNSLVNVFTGTETQNTVSIPVTIEYNISKNRFNPYIAGGLAADFLFSSNLSVERQRPDQTSVPEKNEELEREKFNLSLIAAAGTKLPLGNGFVVIELRYAYGLTHVSSSENAYNNQNLALDYGYSDSVFKLSSLSLCGSYIFNKFNPKKLSRKK